MRVAVVAHDADFDGWRSVARALVGDGVRPEQVIWQVGDGAQDLFAGQSAPTSSNGGAFSVPRRFIDLAELVVCHADPGRFALLYQLLFRLRSQPRLVEDRADPLVHRVEAMARAVARDVHKMRAFVRFREVEGEDGLHYVAWFEPEHHIVTYNVPFFVRRFANMRWSILTPDLCAHYDGSELSFSPGAMRADAPEGDPIEATWKIYYASIFNPARLKMRAMQKEMPKKYWRNLPETSLVPSLIASASTRTNAMLEQEADAMANENQQVADAAEVPESLAAIRESAKSCTRCDLYKGATQTVFGVGPGTARIMFVGEAPGDQEDLQGKPFVGPAGQVFNRALAQAGIDRSDAYVTNAVKHFKFIWRGKRRLHQKPDGPEIEACRFWLEHERALMRPQITVALGATAARSLLGKVVTIAKTRGQPIYLADGSECWVTVHPSFLLRIEDRGAAQIEYERFVQDLITVRDRLAELNAVA